MRLKRLENQWRVWLNPNDYETLLKHAHNEQARLAIRFGGECGLRVSETTNVRYEHVRQSTHPDVDAFFLEVYGKDTTGTLGEMGKFREAFIPRKLLQSVQKYVIEESLSPDDPIFGVTKRTIQAWIKRAAETAAEETGVEDFEKVSSHDLRAAYATDCLIRRDMNVRVVMAVGGWGDYKSMEPYLNATFDDVIADEFEDAGIL